VNGVYNILILKLPFLRNGIPLSYG
jgi:hypothetical protein